MTKKILVIKKCKLFCSEEYLGRRKNLDLKMCVKKPVLIKCDRTQNSTLDDTLKLQLW